MFRDHLSYLVCPSCRGDLGLASVIEEADRSIETGSLRCEACSRTYDIVRGVPRFVPSDNYAESFGWQWNVHPQTQYDSHTSTDISAKRFFDETLWPRNLDHQTILEVGCGSGRFTEQALSTGAMVVSMDYSSAVDANYSSHCCNRNALIVQGNIYAMPFRTESFDKVFCIGVLQHTPNVEEAFLNLPQYLKPGGNLVIDVYAINWKIFFKMYYLLRPITKRVPHAKLYAFIRRYVDLVWPLTALTGRFPGGRLMNRALFFIADYRGKVPLSEHDHREWAVLDTFDTFSPRYDKPQRLSTVKRWFRNSGLTDVQISFGNNGIVGRGTKPMG
jgi:2-polyprenyl-3-methyl-5-hydroxy-6-metoxy-1,4-benzoquinol methylase/uncharacterized protein YbaR (Trm112 family)